MSINNIEVRIHLNYSLICELVTSSLIHPY